MRSLLLALAVALEAHTAEQVARPDHVNWVSRARLRNVKSIDCLHRLQLDPNDPCAPKHTPMKLVDRDSAAWSVGNFPKPLIPELQDGDAKCGAEGELLCDPDEVMTEEDRKKLALNLQMFRENMMVECRLPWLRADDQQGGAATPRELDEHQFRAGVAILRTMPPSAVDDESLTIFGDYLLDSWEVSPRDCSAGLVLIIVTEAQKVWLAAPSCEYCCATDPETGGRVLNALETELGWTSTLVGTQKSLTGEELTSADYERAISNALHELEDVMHEQKGAAFGSGRAVVMPDPDDLWRRRRERLYAQVSPWVEGFVLATAFAVAGYGSYWYFTKFWPSMIDDFATWNMGGKIDSGWKIRL